MHIPSSPTLRDLSPSFAARPAARPFPFNANHFSMWHRGRSAIWHGVHRLGLAPGDRVLAPAYACGAEIEALTRAGLELSFYRVGSDLDPDMAQLERLCRQPARALFVTHYFGYPQPVKALAQFAEAHGLNLIEDNTHGFCSADQDGTPLGSLGDMSVFSFHKTVPIPSGGGLVLKSAPEADAPGAPSGAPSVGRQASALTRMLKKDMIARFPGTGAWVKARLVGLSGRRRGKAKGDRPKPDISVPTGMTEKMVLRPEDTICRMSAVSRLLVRQVDREGLVAARRRNFQILDDALRDGNGPRPVLRPLPPGCCPWMYPVWEDDPEGLVRSLAAEGVIASRFWPNNHPAIALSEFPFERDLKRHVVVLPIHQGLREAQMAKIAALLEAWRAPGMPSAA